MLNCLIRDRLLEILHSSYPDLYNKYKRFMVITEAREVKKYSYYDFKNKTIKIYTLSRKPDSILISGLCELAKHIDIINREETHNDHEYCVILKKLLMEAVNSNSIKKESLSSFNDTITKNLLQKHFHNFNYWKFDVKIDPKYIYIFALDSFMIKNILKTNGFTYDSDQTLWFKRVYISEAPEENMFVEQYKNKAVFKVIGDNSFYIRPVYLIKLKTYAKSEVELLRALEFRFIRDKNYWSKIVSASSIQQEIKNIEHIPRQSLIITRNTKKV